MTESETPTVYELRGVSKSFGRGDTVVHAVRDVDLTIAEGEFVALAGPSGSGKTTLLQLLGGLDRATTGSVLFEGRDLSTLGDGALGRIRLEAVGFVFQQFNLIPTLTAKQNVEVALAPRGVGGRKLAERATELLTAVGLGHRVDHLPGKLSGGEQQRVAIARALANQPRVLLADEPTGNLDSVTGDEIIGLLTTLSRERRQTIVLITHDQVVASRAGRVIRMHDGKLVQEVVPA